MNSSSISPLIEYLNNIDPSPFFVLSLFPYLLFLYWLGKVELIPKYAQWGFRLTLFFVFITIICAVIAQVKYGAELTDVDPLHGSAEAFLTLSDGLIVFGFLGVLTKKK
tara:strand:- start:310 stop:636 length:327 start_codon:yes stop_codon:yes gene_type:complete